MAGSAVLRPSDGNVVFRRNACILDTSDGRTLHPKHPIQWLVIGSKGGNGNPMHGLEAGTSSVAHELGGVLVELIDGM
uniref:Uncharacterized protein n=1 Tax=Oryza sativa subsp. japonica TaxID=39947 RepID=Q6H4R5_ORYSJ|nr:hypothetical protein [Oryza sativa Japonica Group]BAD26284.1 hypothetical protein [Oryza sativa Japonica Group]